MLETRLTNKLRPLVQNNSFFRFLYEKYFNIMFYHAQGRQEISKPLALWTEFGILLGALALYGIKFTFLQIALMFFTINVTMIALGIVFVAIGTVAYQTTLQNNHNPELQKVLKEIDAIKSILSANGTKNNTFEGKGDANESNK